MKNDFRERWLFYLQVVPAITLGIDFLFNKVKFKKKYIRMTIVFMTLFILFASMHDSEHGPVYPENLNWNKKGVNYSKLHKEVRSPSDGTLRGNIYQKPTRNISCNPSE